MNIEKTYQCLCGQEFTTPNKFNAHKRNCETHLRNKYGDEYEAFMADWHKKCGRSSSGKIAHAKALIKKQIELDQWISEQHTCENCGTIMTEKFGSGRFCSRKCSNSRKFSEEAIKKKRNAANTFILNHPEALQRNSEKSKIREELKRNTREKSYLDNPKYCQICGKIIPFSRKNTCSCSKDCAKQLIGGYREGSGIGKHGYYKGYKCDSTYELAYVIYNIDHNILFERSSYKYLYVAIDASVHTYYPDFIQDGFIIEIKGYMNENVYRKIAAVDNYPVKLLTYSDIKPMIEYVQKTYNVKDISELYD